MTTDALARFGEPTHAWFAATFPAGPTPAQAGAWAAADEPRLVVAPTGSGKTLAAFLAAIDELMHEPVPARAERCRVLYVSPLKALAADVERNLRVPLEGITATAAAMGVPVPALRVGVRTGDTRPDERRRMLTSPPDILITTPESLFLLLTSRARETLRSVRTVIVDEVHAVAGTKRGAHLALSLERLDALLPRPATRIGLSATVRPVERVATFLSPSVPARVIALPAHKEWDLRVQVPVDDMTAMGAGFDDDPDADPRERQSIWLHIDRTIATLVAEHDSTLVFANSRRAAERMTAKLNELAAGPDGDGQVIARAHHGSVSHEQRAIIEDDLKSGRLPAVVATSSLELGIDMGAIDLVVQVQTPPSVASGLQRIGRAGHQVGAVSRGIVLPQFRADLLTSAVVVERMRAGLIESIDIPQNPLDVLAQHIIAMVAMDDWRVDDLAATVRCAAPFATLTDALLDAVLDMLAGKYPSDEFAHLRPRLVWDRTRGLLSARPGAQRLAVVSGGTIPDRGLFPVFVSGEKGFRVGELDEEMAYESRVGDVIALGASSWRIDEITHDRVLVTPAPGQPGRVPFWKGDTEGRPAELGAAVGAFVRELGAVPRDVRAKRLADIGLDERAVGNLLVYLDEQAQATGRLPDDRTVVIERVRDELGDWRIVIHSPLGARVHAPWALAIGDRLREDFGIDAQVVASDDGITLRLPDGERALRSIASVIAFDPDEIAPVVTDLVGSSALFAARFREAAGRALLLPRMRPGKRAPLWQQRQRSAHLLQIAAEYASFPIVLEAVRETLQDWYDLPALQALLGSIRDGQVQVIEVETAVPSPFASSLLFGYVAAFLYEDDTPLAERRARALELDASLLGELLGTPELRDLLDPDVIAEVERELQFLAADSRVRDAEDAADVLRLIGPLSDEQVRARGISPAWLRALVDAGRAFETAVAGQPVTAAVEDAARLRDGLGVTLPDLPSTFTEPVADPLGDLVRRFARTHGPFTTRDVAASLGLPDGVVEPHLARLLADGRLVRGAFRPIAAASVATEDTDGDALPPSTTHATDEDEWCDADVLRRIRRRTVAALRTASAPVPATTLAAFLPHWQHVAPAGGDDGEPALRGIDGVLTVIEQLAGLALPASAWESAILPARVADYSPAMLDSLLGSGEVVWWGAGAVGRDDGLVALAPADLADAVRLPMPAERAGDLADDPVAQAVVDVLAAGAVRTAAVFREVSDAVVTRLPEGTAGADDARVEAALWDLVWAGVVTNDGWAALRRRIGGTSGPAPTAGAARAGSRRRRLAMPSRLGPPTAAGRWSVLTAPSGAVAERTAALGDGLLERHGIVTRGAVMAEGVPGGFMQAFSVLSAFEDAGRCQRVHAVSGVGAAQFAVRGAVDHLRDLARDIESRRTAHSARAADTAPGQEPTATEPDADTPEVFVLAAVDPASAYGAALPWPASPTTHQPGRKAGATVVIVDGALTLYAERGGRSLLLWAEVAHAAAAMHGLATAARERRCPPMSPVSMNGEHVLPGSAHATLLADAGFTYTPSGWRLRH